MADHEMPPKANDLLNCVQNQIDHIAGHFSVEVEVMILVRTESGEPLLMMGNLKPDDGVALIGQLKGHLINGEVKH